MSSNFKRRLVSCALDEAHASPRCQVIKESYLVRNNWQVTKSENNEILEIKKKVTSLIKMQTTFLMLCFLYTPIDKRCWRIHDHSYIWGILWTHGDACAVQAQSGQEQAQEQLCVSF